MGSFTQLQKNVWLRVQSTTVMDEVHGSTPVLINKKGRKKERTRIYEYMDRVQSSVIQIT